MDWYNLRKKMFEAQLLEKSAKIKGLIEEHNSYKASSLATISNLQKTIDSRENELSKALNDLKELDKMKINHLNILSENEKQIAKIKELKNTVKIRTEGGDSISQRNMELEETVRKLELDLAQAKTQSSDLNSRIQAEIEKASENTQQFESLLSCAREGESKLVLEYSSTVQKNAELEAQLELLSEELKNEQYKVKSAQEELASAERAKIKIGTLNETLKEKIKAFEVEKAAYIAQTQKERIVERRQYQKEAVDYRVKETQRLQSQISSLEKQKAGLERKLKGHDPKHVSNSTQTELNEMVSVGLVDIPDRCRVKTTQQENSDLLEMVR
jgi:chromosome segregation ATPase